MSPERSFLSSFWELGPGDLYQFCLPNQLAVTLAAGYSELLPFLWSFSMDFQGQLTWSSCGFSKTFVLSLTLLFNMAVIL